MIARVTALVVLLTLAGCAGKRAREDLAPPPPPHGVAGTGHAEGVNPTEEMPLEVALTDQVTTGRHMKLRGRIINPYTEEVVGVRVQLAFVVPDEEGGGKVLELQQKELGSTLVPGGATMLRWDVESLYLGTEVRFIVVAYPKRIGGREMPPPDHWR